MDSTLPQMQSFDFDRLDPIALENTLAYLRQHPEPPAADVALCGSYQGLLDDVAAEMDWMAEPMQLQEMGSKSGDQPQTFSTALQYPGNFTELEGHDSYGPSSSASSASSLPSSSCHTSVSRGYPQRHRCVSGNQMVDGKFTTLPQQSKLTASSMVSSGRGNCTWNGCQQNSYDVGNLRLHLETHGHEALAFWTRQSKCPWQGCKSKALFKTLGLFKTHLENIHTYPLLCTQPRCSYKKPFKNRHELERHISTRHSTERKWECPYDSCSSEIRAFARKDKWLKHIRETPHEDDAFCPYHHCRFQPRHCVDGFQTRLEISNHFGDTHSGRHIDAYECVLGSCGKTPDPSRWSFNSLRSHISSQHDVSMSATAWTRLQSHLEGTDHTFCERHISLFQNGPWRDCSICASRIYGLLNTTPNRIGSGS